MLTNLFGYLTVLIGRLRNGGAMPESFYRLCIITIYMAAPIKRPELKNHVDKLLEQFKKQINANLYKKMYVR